MYCILGLKLLSDQYGFPYYGEWFLCCSGAHIMESYLPLTELSRDFEWRSFPFPLSKSVVVRAILNLGHYFEL